ncbi:MAG: hypothetical protein IKB62_04365 [Oscillospiraceae bacterium]|nr:hypothetical protein [Oscillospiraceae bacterium]
MKETLVQLYNTLALIETKGDGTVRMAACLQATEQLAKQAVQQEQHIADLEAKIAELEKKSAE